MDRGLQERQSDNLPVRLLRSPDGGRVVGQRCLSRRKKAGVGLETVKGEQLYGGRPIPPAPLPQRVENLTVAGSSPGLHQKFVGCPTGGTCRIPPCPVFFVRAAAPVAERTVPTLKRRNGR